jgi:hypothetical protein
MRSKVLRITCLIILFLAFAGLCYSFSGPFYDYIYIPSGVSSSSGTFVEGTFATVFGSSLVVLLVVFGLVFGSVISLFLENKTLRLVSSAFGFASLSFCLYQIASIIAMGVNTNAGQTRYYNMNFYPCLFVFFASVFLFMVLIVMGLIAAVMGKKPENLH